MRKNIRFLNELKLYTSIIAIVLIVLLFGIIITQADSFETIVNINPSSQTVSPEENFTVDVYCIPDQPIKSFELKLLFDSSLLQVNSVTEGNIFNGFTTFLILVQ